MKLERERPIIDAAAVGGQLDFWAIVSGHDAGDSRAALERRRRSRS
jgi:hypothetical protein